MYPSELTARPAGPSPVVMASVSLVGGVVVRRLVPGGGLRPDGGADDKPAGEGQPEHDGEGAELDGRRVES